MKINCKINAMTMSGHQLKINQNPRKLKESMKFNEHQLKSMKNTNKTMKFDENP